MAKKKGGFVVETPSGKGRTRNGDELIGGKFQVFTEDGRRILVSRENLKVIGFWD